MKTNIGLGALTNTTLYTIQIIVATITAGLLSSQYDLKAIALKLSLTRAHNFPCEISLALAISLCAGIGSTMASIQRDNPNVFTSRSRIRTKGLNTRIIIR